jgi:hypothetical protein
MKNTILFKIVISMILLAIAIQDMNAQCQYIPSTSSNTDTLSYAFSGGIFASYGCAEIDPTYWLSGNGNSVTVNFVTPQSYPTFRVWGMNDDDSASVAVNNIIYPLNASTASYDPKVPCGQSPGPDGVIFSGGKLVGANDNIIGNYSHQNIQLIATNVNSFTVTGISGAGWGFAGASINCPLTTNINKITNESIISVYPNPISDKLIFDVDNKEVTTITLFDFYGKQLLQKTFSTSITLNTEELQAGIYFFELRGEQNVITYGKILKQ